MRAIKLFLIFIIATSLCLCAGQKPAKKTPVPTPTPTPTTPISTPTPKPTPTPTPAVSAGGIKLVDGVCLHCHNKPSKNLAYPQALSIPGHVNGSAYCIYCHVPNAKKMTRKQIDEYVAEFHHKTKYAQEGNCQYCHKAITNVSVCGTCHDNGNLIVIHSKYNVGCKACHGYDFMRIHVEKKPFPPKFPIPTKPKEEQKGWI